MKNYMRGPYLRHDCGGLTERAMKTSQLVTKRFHHELQGDKKLAELRCHCCGRNCITELPSGSARDPVRPLTCLPGCSMSSGSYVHLRHVAPPPHVTSGPQKSWMALTFYGTIN